jgi:hypothetical protein
MTTWLAFRHFAHLLAPQISNGCCLEGFLTPDYGSSVTEYPNPIPRYR